MVDPPQRFCYGDSSKYQGFQPTLRVQNYGSVPQMTQVSIVP